MNVLEFRNVSRSYGDLRVLENVGFAVGAGEVVGLLGRNGAGKTTLIHLVMGMLAPTSGSVAVFGLDPRVDPVAVRRRVGYVAEDQELPPFLKVEEVLALHREQFPAGTTLPRRSWSTASRCPAAAAWAISAVARRARWRCSAR